MSQAQAGGSFTSGRAWAQPITGDALWTQWKAKKKAAKKGLQTHCHVDLQEPPIKLVSQHSEKKVKIILFLWDKIKDNIGVVEQPSS